MSSGPGVDDRSWWRRRLHFVDAVDRYFPVLGLVDLATPGDWATAISRCKLRPHTAAMPIIAFGSHVEVATLKQRARRAPIMPGRAAS